MKLDRLELDFVWNLVTLKNQKCVSDIRKIKNKENLIKYLIKHRIDSFFYTFIKQNDLLYELSNEEIELLIKTTSFKNYRYILTLQSAIDISKKLKKNNIPHVFLKGIALSNLVPFYDHPLRDIDIFIPHKNIKDSLDIFKSLNYRSVKNNSYIDNIISNNPNIYDLPQLKNNENVFLEIHYKIIKGYEEHECNFSKDLINNGKIIKKIFNEEFYVSSNEFLLLHYLYHGTRKGNFDVGPSAILNIYLIHKHLNINIDELKYIAYRNSMIYEYNFFKELLNTSKEENFYKNDFKELFLNLAINNKVSFFYKKSDKKSKLRFLLQTIFPSKSFIKKEFNIYDFKIYHYLLIIPRWRRQLILFLKEFVYLKKNKIDMKKRNEIIKRINISIK